MSFGIPFVKMQGLGNDFIVLYSKDLPHNFQLDTTFVQYWGNRRFGVGFDQLIWIAPTNQKNYFNVRFFNQDGSEALQCGNGLRCAARYVVENKLATSLSTKIATGAGEYELTVDTDLMQVAVKMGEPNFTLKDIPFISCNSESHEIFQDIKLILADKELTISLIPVSMGNPHGVIFVENTENIELENIGNLLSKHVYFPQGANIEFVQYLTDTHLKIRIYERGVGETLACGSGACAAMAASRILEKVQEKVTISMPGGDLLVEWQGKDHPLFMYGPAITVFKGIL